jgi:hypothetical protein
MKTNTAAPSSALCSSLVVTPTCEVLVFFFCSVPMLLSILTCCFIFYYLACDALILVFNSPLINGMQILVKINGHAFFSISGEKTLY